MVIMGMRGIIGAVLLGGSTVSLTWQPFASKLYPYSISQPSSFRHEVITTASGSQVDYFFPAFTGSFPTNVNVSAVRGTDVQDEVRYLQEHNGHHVQRVGFLKFMGRHHAIVRADFDGLTGKWVEEQISFPASGYFWRITASYEPRFRRLRPLMLRMLASFRLTSGPSTAPARR